MKNSSILSDIQSVFLLKEEVDKKIHEVHTKSLEVKKNFELFLADDTISLEERFETWIQAPEEMYKQEGLEYLHHPLKKAIDFWILSLAKKGSQFEDKINLAYEAKYLFWNDRTHQFIDIDYTFDGFENDNVEQIIYDIVNYLVTNNIGITYQWHER